MATCQAQLAEHQKQILALKDRLKEDEVTFSRNANRVQAKASEMVSQASERAKTEATRARTCRSALAATKTQCARDRARLDALREMLEKEQESEIQIANADPKAPFRIVG